MTLLVALAVPRAVTALPGCEQHTLSATGRQWQGPLSRAVSLEVRAPLKDALERIAAAAQLRFSYSAEFLPLERDVCLSYKNAALGDVLLDLLKSVSIEPVVAGSDHVVLAPRATSASEGPSVPQPVYPLPAIVATAIAANPQQESPGYSFSVIQNDVLGREASVVQALNAGVPGVWAWRSPSGFTTLYSVRGASSFGASSPKTFIDGIEVANPMLLSQLLPENIERIEVIRGPQGGALYGGDAIDGVTNIVTRQANLAAGAPRLHVRSTLALSGSDYVTGAGVGQDHTVALQFGSRMRSGILNLGVGSLGEYVPGAYTRHVNFDGGMRLLSKHSLITGTVRFSSQSAGNPFGLLTDSLFSAMAVSMQQYTLGTRVLLRQSERVTHSIVLGVDGYALNGVPSDSSRPLSLADSVLRAAGDGAVRTTARISSVANLNVGPRATTAITIGAEHSGLRQHGELSQTSSYTQWSGSGPGSPQYDHEEGSRPTSRIVQKTYDSHFEQSRSTNGMSAQVDASLLDRLFVTGAIRVEQNEVNGVGRGSNALPMLAASYVFGGSDLGVKVRGAYGKAIRWPEMPNRINDWAHGRALQSVISPEQQAGLEAGVDVMLGRLLQLQLTRYDQTATGLIQCVAIANPEYRGDNFAPATVYMLQNVGEIANRGWELQTSLRKGFFALTGGLSFVDSRVLHVADGYTGDLRAGDRMLGVPARTASVDATWMAASWSASLTAYRAFDWVNYDRRALATTPANLLGEQLRDYWMNYGGATHMRATLTRSLAHSFKLLLTGDNLLGNQTGEPDNLTIVPGRTVSFGIRASF